MIVKYKEQKTIVQFGILNIGDVFQSKEEAYIRISTLQMELALNAVNLVTGFLHHFTAENKVTKLFGEFNYSYEEPKCPAD